MDSLNHIQSWAAGMKRSPSWQVLVESTRSAASGAAFGAALTAAGVHSPDVIVNQFRLKDFRMFQVFAVALGSSVFIIHIFDRLAIAKKHINPPTSLGIFSAYDGNIIGGALVGIGMSMSGSCPGTVTAQIAQGVPTALFTAAGGLLGGMTHVWINRPTRRSSSSSALRRSPPRSPQSIIRTGSPTLTSISGLGETALYAIMATVTASLLYISVKSSTGPLWRAEGVGGLYLGLAQLVSLLLTTTTLGATGIYDQAARYAWRLAGRKEIVMPPNPPKSLLFAAGAVLGASLTTSAVPITKAMADSTVTVQSALVGGFFMAFGAKIAKGCTSGHGISGLGAFSFSSLVSVAAMFGAGIVYQLF